MTVYLLHLSEPLRHAKHYMGVCEDLESRLERHAKGDGARMLAVCRERGITWQVVRTWPGDRLFERRLKRRRDSPKLCPVCNPKAMSRGNYKTT